MTAEKCPKCGAERRMGVGGAGFHAYKCGSSEYVSDPETFFETIDCLRNQLSTRDAELVELRGKLAYSNRVGPKAIGDSIDPWGFASMVEIDGKQYEQTGNTRDGKAVYCERGAFEKAMKRFDDRLLFVLDYYKMIPAADYKSRT
jgi:hypothetical protein